MPSRTILHVDMDAFFASVEVLFDPTLAGKPVLVGHDGSRGVVTAASYEARQFGCRSAQPMAVAKRLCPQAIVVPGKFERYREVSAKVFALLREYTPVVEPVSIDEAFMDATGTELLFGDGRALGAMLKRRIREVTGLTASVGVAPNKFLAKLASDLDKPDGLTVLGEAEVATRMPPLPVEKLWGIGPKTAERLHEVGVKTIGQLRSMSADALQARVGDEADHFRRLAWGLDDRPVCTERQAKSVGQEQTFGQNVTDRAVLRGVLLGQAEQVAKRLRQQGLRARCVTVKIRYGAFQTITRRRTLAEPVDTTLALHAAAASLFDAWAVAFKPVRLIGVSAGTLALKPMQGMLFENPSDVRQTKLEEAVDKINQKFGAQAVSRAGVEKYRET